VDPARTPVVVATGQVVDRERSLSALELVVRAGSEAFAASARLARTVERVSVVNILTRSGGPAPATELARALRLQPSTVETTTVGGSAPQWLVQRAATDIAAGRLGSTLIAGAEAVRSGRLRPPPDAPPPRQGTGGRSGTPEVEELPPDPLIGDDRPGSSAEELAAGLAVPAVVYPVLESAITYRAGRSLEAQRHFIGDFLAPFSAVASRHPQAWFPVARSAAEIATPSPDNRLVAEPYTKLMTAFLGGSHGAAVVVTSLAVARAAGIDDGAMFVRSTATADDVWFPSARPDLGSSPAIAAASAAALDAGGLGLDEIGLVDLYSCFPSAVQMAAAAIGLELDDPRGLTVTGGLPYFGGPGSNYATHALATLFDLLRERGGHGLLTALGWMVTKHAVGCYSATPPPGGYRAGDTAVEQGRIDGSALDVVARGEDLGRQAAVVDGATVVYGHEAQVIAAPVIATLADGRRVAAAAEADELPGLAGVALAGASIVVEGRPARYRVTCTADEVEQVG
jgi:acetyl-CoA C-acetyltransferase